MSVARCCLLTGLLRSTSAPSPLLEAIFTCGPLLDDDSTSTIASEIFSAIRSSPELASSISSLYLPTQVVALKYATEEIKAGIEYLDNTLNDHQRIIADVRGLFHISPSVRSSSATQLGMNSDLFQSISNRLIREWEDGASGWEGARQGEGLGRVDVMNLVNLLAEPEIGNSAATELATALLTTPSSTSMTLKALNKTDTVVSTVLSILTSDLSNPHPEHANLLKALALASSEARAYLTFTASSLAPLLSSMPYISDYNTLTPILTTFHRVVFDPSLTALDDVAAYVSLSTPFITPIHPSAAAVFVLPPNVYEATTNGFTIPNSTDEVLVSSVASFFSAALESATSTPTHHPSSIASALTTTISNSKSGKEMNENIEDAHIKCILDSSVAAEFASNGNVIRSMERILSVPPSSARDHELLSSALSLFNTVSSHLPFDSFAAVMQGMSKTALAVLDVSNITPSMAADGIDVNGFNKPKNRYGSDLTLREAKKLEKKANRALRALWSARHAMQCFLYTFLSSPQAYSEIGVNGLSHLQHIALRTKIPTILASNYLSPRVVDNFSPEYFHETARSQANAVNLLHLLVEDDVVCQSFAATSTDEEGTMFEVVLPKLIAIVAATRMPDSFLNKAVVRAAAPLLKTIAASCTLTMTTSSSMSLLSSKKQQREKRQWCNDTDSLAWIYKLLCDRESGIRSCGYGICSDLLNLAWARPLILSRGEDDGEIMPEDEEASFYRFSTTILEMACRVASDDSECPLVRSESLALLHNACCVGGAALSNSSADVLDVIPSVGRILARAAKHMASDSVDDNRFADGDSTTGGSSEGQGGEEEDDEAKLMIEAVLLPTPTLLWAGIKLLRCLLVGVLQNQETAPTETLKSSGGDSDNSPNSSMGSSYLQEEELATHFYESGILSHAINLLSTEGMKRLTIRAQQAHLGLLDDVNDFSIGGIAAEPTTEIWEEVEEAATFATKSCVFDLVTLAIAISRGTESEIITSNNVSICSSLLRHTSLLTQSFKALTIEVAKLTRSLQNSEAVTDSNYEQLNAVASCSECLKEVVDASADRVAEDGSMKIVALSNLIPLVGSVPEALGVALNYLALLSANGSIIKELDDACCSMNRLTRLLLTVPGWGEGILKERDGMSMLTGLLEVHHSRALKRTNAANLPMTERILTLKEGLVSGSGFSNECRIASCTSLAAAFDAARNSGLDDLIDRANKVAEMGLPDLLSELNDICALVALDSLRSFNGDQLRDGKRRDKARSLVDGSADWKPNDVLVFELCATLIVIRSAVALPGGKLACLEDRVSLVNLIKKVWPIAMDLEFVGGGKKVIGSFGEGLLEMLLGVVLNFVSGDLMTKQSIDSGARGGRDNITGKVVSLVLRKASKTPGEGARAVGENILRLGFSILKSLALPPSSSRGTLAVSGIFPSCAKMISVGLRGGGTNNTMPRIRKGGSFMVRAEGVIGLFVNATLDGEGRKAVFGNDFDVFRRFVHDLIAVGKELNYRMKNGLLMLLRNICLDKTKSYVLSSQEWLAFILDSCTATTRSVRSYALQCLWMLLYKSEKAVAVVKEGRNMEKVLAAEALLVEEGRRGKKGEEGDEDDNLLIAKSMDAITTLMGGDDGE